MGNKGKLGGFCYDGIQLNVLSVPKNCENLNESNLSLTVYKEAGESFVFAENSLQGLIPSLKLYSVCVMKHED